MITTILYPYKFYTSDCSSKSLRKVDELLHRTAFYEDSAESD